MSRVIRQDPSQGAYFSCKGLLFQRNASFPAAQLIGRRMLRLLKRLLALILIRGTLKKKAATEGGGFEAKVPQWLFWFGIN